MQSGAGDAMVLETAKERYKSRTGGSVFKCFHWWNTVKHQPKWRAKFVGSSSTNPWVSLSDRTTEEEVSHPMDRDRAKATTWKGKESSSTQSKPSSTMGVLMSTLKRLSTSFAKV
jgi:hypothetical protein